MTSPDGQTPAGARTGTQISGLQSISSPQGATGNADIMDGLEGIRENLFVKLLGGFVSVPAAILSAIGALIAALTGSIGSILGGVFGGGGSRAGAKGWDAPPPVSQSMSGVIDSMSYLATQVATMQSNGVVVGYGSNGSWIKPDRAKRIRIVLVAGAGGGGKGGVNSASYSDAGWLADVSNHGCGGGGGGFSVSDFDADLVPDHLIIEIGLGGAGATGAPGEGVWGGDGTGARVLDATTNTVFVEVGPGFGGGPGEGSAPSEFNRGKPGFGNQGACSGGGNGGQGPGTVGFTDVYGVGAGFGAVIVAGKARLPARAAWPQRGDPGPYSPGAPNVFGSGMTGLPGEQPRRYPINVGPGSGASGGMYNDASGGTGGRGGHGTYWGSAGGGGGSSKGGASEQSPGDGGNGGSAACWIFSYYT